MKTHLICALASIGILLGACNSDRTNEKSSDAEMDSIAATPQLVKTADIRFKVKDAAKCGWEVSALARSMQGMVMHHNLQSMINNSNSLPVSEDSVLLVTSYAPQADITVKIPSEAMETFMDKVADMAVFVDNRTMNIEDKSLEYLSNVLKAENRADISKQLEKPKKLGVKEAGQLLDIKDDKVDHIVSNYRTQADAEYSTVSLAFYQNNFITREKVANTNLAVYRVPFATSLGNAFTNGLHGFEALLIVIANLWAFILLAAAIWFSWKWYARTKLAAHANSAAI